MKREIRILFTGIGRRVELIQAFRQASLVLDLPIKLYGADRVNTAPALAYCDQTKLLCGMRDAAYIDQLLLVCRQEKIDLLIPTIDTDLMVLAENRERFAAEGIRVLISAPEMIRVCRNKFDTAAFFDRCGLKSPIPVKKWEDYTGGFPAFIKPVDGSSSIGASRVDAPEELPLYAGQLSDYIVQPFIRGEEYTIDIFCDFDGKPITVVPRKRLAVRAGEVLKTQICMDPKIIGEAERLIRAFRPCGPLTVQMIRQEETGEDYFIEINPRFGGGAPLSMKAGARSVEALLKLAAGRQAERIGEISDGAVYSRFDNSVCIDPGTVPERIRGVIFDLDDTLYPERAYVLSGFRAVAEYLNEPSAAEEMARYFDQGKPAVDEYLRAVNRTGEKEACLNVYRNHRPSISLRPEALPLLKYLREQGVRIGIITDGRPQGQRNKIAALRLDSLADDIIITDELGGPQFRKPNDIAFRILQRRWMLPFEQLMYIGDNPSKDFQAPRQLGMRSVWLRCPDGLYFSPEDALLFRGTEIHALDEVGAFAFAGAEKP